MTGEAFAHRIIHGVNHDNRLLGGANHAVIEGFGHQDRGDGAFDIGRFVNHYRRIARADADRRFTGAVSGFHHAGTAGRQNKVDVRMVHQLIREFDRRRVDPADNIFWRAGGDGGLQHDIRRFIGGFFSARMRREDNAVTRFQADQRLENRR